MHDIKVEDANIKIDSGGNVRIAFEFIDATKFSSFAQKFNGAYFALKKSVMQALSTWNSSLTLVLMKTGLCVLLLKKTYSAYSALARKNN